MFENILFPVSREPLVYNGNKTDFSLIVRKDTDKVLSVNSNDYVLIPNKLIVDKILSSVGKDIDFGHKYTKNGIFSNDKVFHVNLVTKFDAVEVQKGDYIGLVLSIINSYDCSKSLRLNVNALRLVCSNGMVASQQLFQASAKHIGNKNPEVIVQEMIDTLKTDLMPSFEDLAKTFMKMAKKKLNDKLKETFIKKISSYPKYIVDEIVQQIVKTKPATLWDLYNCVTYVMTHRVDRTKMSVITAEEGINKDVISML